MTGPRLLLAVDDLDRTIAWYSQLGFVCDSRDPASGAVGWCRLVRKGLALEFLAGDTPWGGAPAMTGTLYVPTGDVQATLHALGPGVSAPWGVEERPWGSLEAVLVDPDGYHVTLVQE